MNIRKLALSIAVVAGAASGVYAQGTGESIVKLPDQIEWKGPAVSPGPSRAVLYGDPTKPGVYVERVKFRPASGSGRTRIPTNGALSSYCRAPTTSALATNGTRAS
jgi:hypothetical protein